MAHKLPIVNYLLVTYFITVNIILEKSISFLTNKRARPGVNVRKKWRRKTKTKYVLRFSTNFFNAEFYGGTEKGKYIFLTDKISQKGFCVGGLFYPIILCNPKLDSFEGHKRTCDYGPNGKTKCPHCKMEHLKREKKQHQDVCLEFYKFKNKELEKKVTNLEKSGNELTRKMEEINRQNTQLRQNEANFKNKLEIAEKTLKDVLERNSTQNVPIAPLVANIRPTTALVAPPIGENNIFEDLNSRLEIGELIQETEYKSYFIFLHINCHIYF